MSDTDNPGEESSPLINEESWDDGIFVAFGKEETAIDSSVAEVFEKRTGTDSHVFLEETDEGGAPALRPLSGVNLTNTRSAGGYEMRGEIARGGVGVVLQGRDVDLGRDVAVKVLRDRHLGNTELIRRFVDEAQIGGQLQHPGVVPVYELGIDSGKRPFFTMKLVRGKTLSDLLGKRKGPDSERHRFLTIFDQVCQTMAYAHSRGVIHRDLKPGNIMVGAFGEVQVMDWGFAKVLKRNGKAGLEAEPVEGEAAQGADEDDMYSRAGSVYGTPAYMSPEQARGGAAVLDERADVFSLGAILCEILTGRPPYSGEKVHDVLHLAAGAKLDDAMEVLDACDADAKLVQVTKQCLAPEQRARPRSAGVMAREITAYLTAVEDRAQKARVAAAEARVQASAEKKARRLILALAVSVVAILILGAGAAWWIKSLEWARIEETEADVSASFQEASRLRADGKWAEALGVVRHAHALVQTGKTGAKMQQQAVNLLQEYEGAERNRKMEVRLAEIRSQVVDYYSMADKEYTEAFKAFGIDVDRLSLEEVAVRLRGLDIKMALILATALDDWALKRLLTRRSPRREYRALFAAAKVADPDPWRCNLRDAAAENDLDRLRSLAGSMEGTKLSAVSLDLLGVSLRMAGDMEKAVSILKDAYCLHPGDYWINHHLSRFCSHLEQSEDAERHAMIAMSLRPRSSAARFFMARISRRKGDSAAAERYVREALAINPDNYGARLDRARFFQGRGGVDPAIREARRALRSRPDFADGHLFMGEILGRKGDHEASGRAYLRAFHLRPRRPEFSKVLEDPLMFGGEFTRSIAVLRDAISTDPEKAELHLQLGTALYYTGDFPAAAAACREAIRLDVGYQAAHAMAGHSLLEMGKYREAGEEYGLALELGYDSPWTWDGKDLCERMADLAEKLTPEGDLPSGAEEPLLAARIYLHRGYPAQAVHHFEEALKRTSRFRRWGRRLLYRDAACAAVQMGESRQKALVWLRKSQVRISRKLKTSRSREFSRDAALFLQQIRHDIRFAAVRDEAELKKLPEAEQREWEKFWQEVQENLTRARMKYAAGPSSEKNARKAGEKQDG